MYKNPSGNPCKKSSGKLLEKTFSDGKPIGIKNHVPLMNYKTTQLCAPMNCKKMVVQ
jgi:hypothetical protein